MNSAFIEIDNAPSRDNDEIIRDTTHTPPPLHHGGNNEHSTTYVNHYRTHSSLDTDLPSQQQPLRRRRHQYRPNRDSGHDDDDNVSRVTEMTIDIDDTPSPMMDTRRDSDGHVGQRSSGKLARKSAPLLYRFFFWCCCCCCIYGIMRHCKGRCRPINIAMYIILLAAASTLTLYMSLAMIMTDHFGSLLYIVTPAPTTYISSSGSVHQFKAPEPFNDPNSYQHAIINNPIVSGLRNITASIIYGPQHVGEARVRTTLSSRERYPYKDIARAASAIGEYFDAYDPYDTNGPLYVAQYSGDDDDDDSQNKPHRGTLHEDDTPPSTHQRRRQCSDPYGHACHGLMTHPSRPNGFVASGIVRNSRLMDSVTSALGSSDGRDMGKQHGSDMSGSLDAADNDGESTESSSSDLSGQMWNNAQRFYRLCGDFARLTYEERVQHIASHGTLKHAIGEIVQHGLNSHDDLAAVWGQLSALGVPTPIGVAMRGIDETQLDFSSGEHHNHHHHGEDAGTDHHVVSFEKESGLYLFRIRDILARRPSTASEAHRHRDVSTDTRDGGITLTDLYKHLSPILDRIVQSKDISQAMIEDAWSVHAEIWGLYNDVVLSRRGIHGRERGGDTGYEPSSIAKMQATIGHDSDTQPIHLDQFLQGAGLHKIVLEYDRHGRIVTDSHAFFSGLGNLASRVSIEAWRGYLAVASVVSIIEYLPGSHRPLSDNMVSNYCTDLTHEFFPLTMCRTFRHKLENSRYHKCDGTMEGDYCGKLDRIAAATARAHDSDDTTDDSGTPPPPVTYTPRELVGDMTRNILHTFKSAISRGHVAMCTDQEAHSLILDRIDRTLVYVGRCTVVDHGRHMAFTDQSWMSTMAHMEANIDNGGARQRRKDTVHRRRHTDSSSAAGPSSTDPRHTDNDDTILSAIESFTHRVTWRMMRHDEFDIYQHGLVNMFTTINAWYDRLLDQVVIPPGLLQFPLFSVRYRPWQLYAVLGTVIAHEIYHGIEHRAKLIATARASGGDSTDNRQCSQHQFDECVKSSYGGGRYADITHDENKADVYGIFVSFHTWRDVFVHDICHDASDATDGTRGNSATARIGHCCAQVVDNDSSDGWRWRSQKSGNVTHDADSNRGTGGKKVDDPWERWETFMECLGPDVAAPILDLFLADARRFMLFYQQSWCDAADSGNVHHQHDGVDEHALSRDRASVPLRIALGDPWYDVAFKCDNAAGKDGGGESTRSASLMRRVISGDIGNGSSNSSRINNDNKCIPHT